MSLNRKYFHADQPESFEFTAENQAEAKKIIAKYPEGRQASAVMPLLDLAQRQHDNWLPRAAMDLVGDMLDMPRIRVYEVATFYTMYNLKPIGNHFIQPCTTTPCWLRGSDDVMKAIKDKLDIGNGESTEDGMFTVQEAECLGACVNAPMVQIGDDYYEDLDYDSMCKIIDDLTAGREISVGPQVKRHKSCNADGPTTLKDMAEGV
ncbi:MAG: NAD(P)H-dependent oxidoreductase subunit E [Alphaproteobacteria bacterium]